MEKEVQLTDGSISLRPYHPDDAELVYNAVRESLSELLPWMPWAHPDYSIEETKTWIKSCAEMMANDTEYNFGIFDAKNGAYLGGCGLNQVSPAEGFANLGYWVRSSRTKQGIALAAARLLARFAFEVLKLKRLEVGAATGNKASQRVAEKLGAKRVGIQKNKLIIRDKVYDRVVFSLLQQNLKKR